MKVHFYAVTALASLARAQIVPRPREAHQGARSISEVTNDVTESMSLSMASDYQFVDFLKWSKSSKVGGKSSKAGWWNSSKTIKVKSWKKTFFTTTTSTTTSTCSQWQESCSSDQNCCQGDDITDFCFTPLTCCLEADQSLFCDEAGVGTCTGFCSRRLRADEENPVREDLTPQEVLELINANEPLGARPDATFTLRYNLISQKSCDALIDYVESSLASDIASGVELPVGTASVQKMEEQEESWLEFEDGGIDNQYNKKLYANDLIKLIGREETLKIVDFVEEVFGPDMNVDCMYIARNGETKEDQFVTPWHMDDYTSVEIFLNNDFEGGEVVYMNADGIHKTKAPPGSATAHKNDILHGITPKNGGARYTLLLKHHFDRPDKEGVIRLSKDMVDMLSNGQLNDIVM